MIESLEDLLPCICGYNPKLVHRNNIYRPLLDILLLVFPVFSLLVPSEDSKT